MWDELLKNLQKLKKINESAFSAVDLNNDNRIQAIQLQQVMRITAQDIGLEKPSKQEIKQVMKSLDKQSKGYLTKDDFMVLVKQVLLELKRNDSL